MFWYRSDHNTTSNEKESNDSTSCNNKTNEMKKKRIRAHSSINTPQEMYMTKKCLIMFYVRKKGEKDSDPIFFISYHSGFEA